jgi:hypothetical protein
MNRFAALCFILLLSLSSGAFAWRLIRIPSLTDSDFSTIASMGYDIANSSRSEGFVDIMVEDRFVEDAMLRFPHAKALPQEWAQPMDGQSRNEFGYYYGPNENNAFWANLAAGSDLVDTPVAFAQSFQSRDIYHVRITNAGPEAPVILFNALTHGREPGGNSALIDFAQWLASEYGSDTMATFILDNAQVYFVPMVNIDAYYHNLPSGGADQRKNMNFTTPVASSGIDLNRNWSYMWAYDNQGSSPDPYSATYRGSAAFSEPETQGLRDLIEELMPLGGFNFHTYGGYLIYPWGYQNQPTPDQATFQSWGAQMAGPVGYEWGRCYEVLSYPSNGDACDWEYGDQGMFFFTPEVDDNGFWGSQNDTTLIVTNNLECRSMSRLLCMNLLASVGIEAQEHTGVGEGVAPSVDIAANPVGSVLSFTVQGFGAPVVSVHDLSGRVVATVSDSGTWAVPSGMANGIYYIVARENGASASRAFTVLR